MKGKSGAESQCIDYWHKRWFEVPLSDVNICFNTVMMKKYKSDTRLKKLTNGKE